MRQIRSCFKNDGLHGFRRLVFFIVALCLFGTVLAQQTDELTDKVYMNALQYANGAHKPYNPEKALKIMTSLANEGVPKAMNAVGIMYADGKGTEPDFSTAIQWFKKAAEAGYLRSYYNWSLMWKYGFGKETNYTESYNLLRKGADAGEPNCQYGVGYMHYKGLGCKQDYGLAMEYFQKSAESFNPGATYMIGLCLRNGYGFQRDTAQAREWLQESARSGNARAAIELKTVKPENSYNSVQMISGKRHKSDAREIFRGVSSDSVGNYLSDRYQGYVITYDWSREYVINISPLILSLSAENNQVTGRWVEDDTITAQIKAVLRGDTLSFYDSYYERPNHYNPDPFRSEFKTAHLSVSTDGASVWLTGSLALFSDITMEPMQPVTICLRSAAEGEASAEGEAKASQETKLIAFTNPFTGKFCLSIDMEEEADVHAEIFTLSGILIMEADCGRLLSGRNIVPLPGAFDPGLYKVRIRYGNKETSCNAVKL